VAPADATRDGAVPVPRARDRGKHVIAATATLMALWLGMTAPSISPVAAHLPAVTAPAVTPNTVAAAPVAPVQDGGGGDGR